MPNWCYNTVSVSHEDAAMIARFVEATKSGNLFNEFVPMPDALRDTTSPSEPDETLIEKYGHSDWYSWSIANWGTKWCETESDVSYEGEKDATVYFNTAWSPPIEFYNALVKQGFSVDATYTEEGMGFAGHYLDGVDNCVELDFDKNSEEWINEIEDEDLRWLVQEEYDSWADSNSEEE